MSSFVKAAALALICATAAVSAASAAPPPSQTAQAPGFYRYAAGDFTVTALYDGYVDLQLKLLHGLPEKQVQDLVARMFLDHSKGVQTAVNAYLVHTGEHLALVDAGAAACFGPTMGKITDNIRAAGYRPEDVDTVLLTHMHPDHICGLTDKDGKAVFPNARVYASGKDADFWLNEQTMQAAPEGNRVFFKMAMDAVAPYKAAGMFQTFQDGQALIPGFVQVPSNGHTPGHTSYLLKSKNSEMLVWGDIIHNHAVQFSHPEVSLEFDVDQKQAVKARKAIMKQAADHGWIVAGAHLPFPGLGHIRREKKNYSWVPVEYGPIRSDR